MSGMSLDEFLGHETRESSGGANFLRGWRKRNPPAVDTFLCTRAPIIALWQHNFPRIHVREDEKTKKTYREVWSGNINCLEPESVLRKQYRRDDDGHRDHPPQVCPMCILIEHIREAVLDGSINIADPLFEFVGDGGKEHSRIIHPGGLTSLVGWDKLPDELVEDARRGGIRMSEAWKENAYAKCNYLFRVVDADNPKDGIQVAIETTLLGDKVKEVIRDQMTALGEDDGNPLKKPYCIRWEHRPSEKEFGKKYKAIAMPKVALTDEIRALIDADPPDVSHIVARPNLATLRTTLEQHCKIDLDWDAIFAPAEALYGSSQVAAAQVPAEVHTAAAAQVDDALGKTGKVEQPPAEAKPAGRRRKKVEPEPPPPPKDDVEVVACDECGADMKATDTTCAKCGTTYDFDDPADAAPVAAPSTAATKEALGEDKIPF